MMDKHGKKQRRKQRRPQPPPPPAVAVSYSLCPSTAASAVCGHSGGRSCRVRSVAAYVHTFSCSAKRRWVGRTLADVFQREFSLSAAYCSAAIAAGLIRVDGRPQQPQYEVRDGDRLEHVVHRHEPAVHVADGVAVIHSATASLVVANKPSGAPVHPSGPFLHNSLTLWLAVDRPLDGGQEYLPVHRLDRLTSGLTLLATSSASASAVGKQIMDRSVRKHYVARVHGAFPAAVEGASVVSVFGDIISSAGPVRLAACSRDIASLEDESAGETQCWWRLEAPIECVDEANQHRRSVRTSADPLGTSKPSETLFRVISTVDGGRESVVECVPVTGRTHQLRVHLQFLGFPIVNDPLYGKQRGDGSFPETQQEAKADADTTTTSDNSELELIGEGNSLEHLEKAARAMCATCRAAAGLSTPTAVIGSVDYAGESQALWLHAFRYRSRDWDFSVPLPAWASPDS